MQSKKQSNKHGKRQLLFWLSSLRSQWCFCAFIATLSIFHFCTPTHEEGIDLRATRSVRRTRSLQCQRSLIVAGDGATPSRHLLNYPCLRCLHCLLLLVGPHRAPNNDTYDVTL